MVVVSLVVLVPLVTHLDSVEVAWFSGTVCLCPFGSTCRDVLLGVECFFVIVEASGSLTVIQCTGDSRRVVPLRFRRQGEIGGGRLGAMTSWNVAELEYSAPVLNLLMGQHNALYSHRVSAYQSLLEVVLFQRDQRLFFRIQT